MVNKAVASLCAEMESKKKNAYVQVIGAFLLKYLDADSTAAAKILATGKTIEGSLAHMQSVAAKQKQGNVAVLSDEQGYRAVLDYYGVESATAVGTIAPVENRPAAVQPHESTRSGGFDLDLDDLLAE